MDDLAERAAANVAAWHEVCLSALGIPSVRHPRLWATDRPIPVIFHCAITLGPAPPEAELGERAQELSTLLPGPDLPASVCDTWNILDLEPEGFTRERSDPCLVRPAGGPAAAARPVGIEIELVRDVATLAAFEETAVRGFGGEAAPPYTFHTPSLLDDPRMTMWLGRVEGVAVGTSLSFVEGGVIGVYGVAVVPEARRRGYGEALSWVATLVRPELPAALQASEEGEPLYRRMGYRQAGTFAHWSRPVRP